MIGQTHIIENINTYTIDTLPRSMLMVGEVGCGKHTLCQYICDKFGLVLYDFSDLRKVKNDDKESKTLGELLSEFYTHTFFNLIVFDASLMYDRDECEILKFLEEPPSHTFIAIVTQNERELLETIRNRCMMFRFETYTSDELRQFIRAENINTELLLQVCSTPGQVQQFQSFDFAAMYNYINLIIDRFELATDSNILNISNKVAFKDEKDKFNSNAFIRTLLYCAREKCLTQTNNRTLIIYKKTCDMVRKFNVIGVDKKNVFENYLINLKLSLERNRV